MFAEQIIELRGLLVVRICTPTTDYFHHKTKIFKANLRVDYYLLIKCCTRQKTLLAPTWAKSLTKFNLKMQDFKHAWT